jgi:hypothetical protein
MKKPRWGWCGMCGPTVFCGECGANLCGGTTEGCPGCAEAKKLEEAKPPRFMRWSWCMGVRPNKRYRKYQTRRQRAHRIFQRGQTIVQWRGGLRLYQKRDRRSSERKKTEVLAITFDPDPDKIDLEGA